jgi:hypothetical protein
VGAETPEILPKNVRDAFCIVQRDDGLFEIGLGDDAPGPFESREFALRVASGVEPAPAPTAKFRRIGEVRHVASS